LPAVKKEDLSRWVSLKLFLSKFDFILCN
jgi:hypothetical protein